MQVSLEGMAAHSMAELRQEIAVQKSLDHPNIVKVFETFEDPRRQELHIIMEMCTGGALVSRMKTHRHGYGERAAATLLEKMLSATMYCHKHGVVHRDIKLDNFIYENEAEDAELKLIDFGFASFVAPGKESMWDQIGTPSYMAPELWSERQKARADPGPLSAAIPARPSCRPLLPSPYTHAAPPSLRPWPPPRLPLTSSPPHLPTPSLTRSPRRPAHRSTTRRSTCGLSASSRTCSSLASAPSTTRIARRRRA